MNRNEAYRGSRAIPVQAVRQESSVIVSLLEWGYQNLISSYPPQPVQRKS